MLSVIQRLHLVFTGGHIFKAQNNFCQFVNELQETNIFGEYQHISLIIMVIFELHYHYHRPESDIGQSEKCIFHATNVIWIFAQCNSEDTHASSSSESGIRESEKCYIHATSAIWNVCFLLLWKHTLHSNITGEKVSSGDYWSRDVKPCICITLLFALVFAFLFSFVYAFVFVSIFALFALSPSPVRKWHQAIRAEMPVACKFVFLCICLCICMYSCLRNCIFLVYLYLHYHHHWAESGIGQSELRCR